MMSLTQRSNSILLINKSVGTFDGLSARLLCNKVSITSISSKAFEKNRKLKNER